MKAKKILNILLDFLFDTFLDFLIIFLLIFLGYGVGLASMIIYMDYSLSQRDQFMIDFRDHQIYLTGLYGMIVYSAVCVAWRDFIKFAHKYFLRKKGETNQ